MKGSFLILPLLSALAAPAEAWTVERSASSDPGILSWEFFQEPSDAAWDSVEIRIAFKPDLAVASRILSWPGSGPWASARPVMEADSLGVRLKVRADPAAARDPARAAPMVTFSLELRAGSGAGFAEAEAGITWRGFGGEPLASRGSPSRPRLRITEKLAGRDALGRRQARAAKWALTASTMRGAALPSP